jgi:hypothetical protein
MFKPRPLPWQVLTGEEVYSKRVLPGLTHYDLHAAMRSHATCLPRSASHNPNVPIPADLQTSRLPYLLPLPLRPVVSSVRL